MLLGYHSNSLQNHRFEDALALLARHGYQGIAITPDTCHLDPDRTSDRELSPMAGLTGGGGHANGEVHGSGFADSVVNSALRFRAQAPLVDQLLREIGLDAGDINRLAGGAAGGQTALPPAAQKE